MYRLTSNLTIQRLADGALIPPDPANRDYAEYLGWLAQGNEPEPYVEPPAPTPHFITKAESQALRQLAYNEESDPLFFKWQRGEIEKQEWLDKVEEIKVRYPNE